MPENAETETYSQVGNMPEQPAPAPVERPSEPLHIALAGSSISTDIVDTVLRDGGNRKNSVLRIAAYFMKDKTPAENAGFLRREFVPGKMSQPGGKGFQIGLEQTSVWFDETGITLGRGKSALHTKDSAHITWEQAAVRIRELLDAGQYVSHDVMDEALDNEPHELADRLLFLYRDDFRGFREMPDGWRVEGGWPEYVTRVKELLEDRQGEYSEYSLILERLEEDVAALSTDSDAPTRFWHDPHRLLQDVRDLEIAPVTFPAANLSAPAFMPFITEDEVDAYLTKGSNVDEGKLRIFSFFLHDHSPKERADFLKNQYGTGGQSHALSGADGSWADYQPGKGIILKRGGLSEPYDTVTLTWSAAEKRISKLIQDGRYMSRAGLDHIPEYERMILAREIAHFFYDLPEEYQRPFPDGLDFYYPHDAERAAISRLLDNPDNIDALLATMRPTMENTPPEDRYYNARKRAYDDLTAWSSGVFTLFPGVETLPDPELTAVPRPKPTAQLTLFDMIPQPNLRSVESQQAVIVEAIKDADAKETHALSLPITQDEIDALLFAAVENPESRARIHRAFSENPRSREAARVIKEEYGHLTFTMPRMDGADGYLGLLGEDTGVVISKGAPATTPLSERPPAETQTLTWAKLHKRVAELVEAGRFIAIPEQIAPIPAALGHPYAVGDTVYLENDKPYVIESIDFDIRLRDPSLAYPISRSESRESFERLLRLNPKNKAFIDFIAADLGAAREQPAALAEPMPEPETPEEAPTIAESDFDTVAATALERVMQDDDYVAALTDAKSRASLRNPCTWALEQSIRDHEQDEPAVYQKYFNDYDWNERLFNYVLRESWANRPQPEQAVAEQEQPGDAEITEIDDILSSVDVELIRQRLENPTPEDNARIDGMLAAAEEIARQFDRENGITEESDTHVAEITQDDIDAALLRWNGDLESKILVYQYMRAYPRARDTASFLRDEYAEYSEDGGNPDGFPVTKKGAEPMTVPWPVVQRHIARLMEAGLFFAPEEQRYADRELDNVWGEGESLPDTDMGMVGQAEPEPPSHVPSNFRIIDDHLGEGGPKTKYGYNVAAIRALKQIETEGRAATPEEQETLSRYVGWGGIPQAFDAERVGWQKEYAELKELLAPEEYEMARASTLNAHYTSPTVIKAIYETVGRMGFKSGNVLEPACGVGNFFGLLPENMKNARLYGVELDSVTGRIARQLYPGADIKVMGYEKTDMPDAFFDLAIGNVPFGNYPIVDKRYKQNFHIHDYFFAKTLDQVRPGGIVAFITSKGTMDKQNPEVRKYIAQRAELLGAVRLPNSAFLKNAGTEVTADILFFKRRDRLMDIEPDWVHLGHTEDSIPVNRYFADNPEMILGTMAYDGMMYGDKKETTCQTMPEADLAEQLHAAMPYIEGQIDEAELDDIEGIEDESIPADPGVRNFSYTVVDDRVYFRENSAMYPVELPATTLDRIRGMVELRNCVHELIDLQLNDYGDAEIAAAQGELNRLYDAFTAEYGLINNTANSRAFSADSAYYLLCSLELLDEDNNLERKADMFTRRTIKQKTVITSVDTADEALAVSIAERARVDLPFMAQLSGKDEETLKEELKGVIFLNVGGAASQEHAYVTADEYLSGNVREKLALAQAANDALGNNSLAVNVEALEAAQPKDLTASEISVRLGSTWVGKEYVQQFVFDLLQPTYNLKNSVKVNYFEYTGEWQVDGRGRIPYNNILATVTYGTERMNAYQIIHETLNLRDARVYDIKYEDGKEMRVLNKNETMKAQQKQDDIKREFKEWIWKDPERRQTLVRRYNDLFNSSRPREYDGSHITFSGISPDITLRSHQLNAVAHILYGGNTLLAHEVGAGKTFEMAAAAMESKRLGLCNKSLLAVPNHLTEQWASEFLRLYPSANILVATKRDFEMRNRKKFCAKIATGDYDAVIIGHSQLEKIPMSRERQERLLNEQLDEVLEGIEEVKANSGERFTIKQLEKTRKSLEARLEKLADGSRRDDVVTFEQLGVDRLFIDESHFFKNLFLHTKMRNVAGLSASDAQKSSDLFMKCRYMDELTGGKGIIFATGTPISNSMTEMYTIQRYLQYDLLVRKNLTHFDAWASTFGETVTAIELAPEGTGYRARTRFAKFHNLPELMSMFKEVADVKTADTLDLPRPEANYETIVVKPSELQQDMVQELSERAALVHANLVDPKSDNMLKITSDGRKIGLDQRLINPMLPDDEGSKVNACADNVLRVWRETAPERLTQLLFCDFSTPNKDGRFNVYDDIRAKLLEKGIPEDEIAFIHDANTETRKKELFAKVRQGKVRVLFGSTFKMGSGTNVQDRLIALHDLDCPWRPSDLEQRSGRIVRQGNNNPEVYIYRYATEGTFDAYLWQTVENKQKFISQIMTSKSPVRSCEDVDETSLSYAEIKALCAGNPLIKEKIDLDIEVARLRLLKADHQSKHYELEDNLLKYYPENIEAAKARIAGAEKDTERYNTNLPKAPEVTLAVTEAPACAGAAASEAEGEAKAPAAPPFPAMTVMGVEYTEKEPAAKALLEACKTVTGKDSVMIGSYLGFDMSISFDSFHKKFTLTLKGELSYSAELGTDTFGNITRINNALRAIPERRESAKAQLENLCRQVEDAKKELQNPFALEGELTAKEARLALINTELNIDGGRDAPEIAEPELRQVAYAKNPRPSILEGLRMYGIGKENSHSDKPKTNDRIM